MTNETWNPREPDVRRFTEGDCHYLARALQKLTGWPIYAFDSNYHDEGDLHAFVKTPDGRILDIEGLHTVAEFMENWSRPNHKRISVYKWPKMRADWGRPDFGPYSYKRARVMAARLLDHFGYARVS